MTVLTTQLTKTKLGLSAALLQILAGSLFIAASAQISIPLLFTPVPLTLQTLAVMLVGAFLGRNKGALAAALYLAEISFGLPFLSGGVSMPLALVSVKGGYLLGMVVQAALTGWYYEKQIGRSFKRDFFFNALTGLITLSLGSLWLSAFVGVENALIMGFYPFLIGDAIKSALVTKTLIQRHRIKL